MGRRLAASQTMLYPPPDPDSPRSLLLHPREAARLRALAAYRFPARESEPLFDRFALYAASATGTPLGFFNVIREDDQISPGRLADVPEFVAREESFCAHTILAGGPLVVPDARADERFAGLTWVRNEPGIRFYAGVPVADGDDLPLGSLCVIDFHARRMPASTLRVLGRLAELLALSLRARRELVADLEAADGSLTAADVERALARSRESLQTDLASFGRRGLGEAA